MAGRLTRWTWAAGVVMLAVAPRPSAAQPPPTSSTSASMGPFGTANTGMLANPYANPYLNPFLNPYMAQGQLQGNALMYLFAAQQATGGIGSGRISGVRPAKPAVASHPTTTAGRRATDIPGASAAQYFNRTYTPAASTARYYNRQGRYHPSTAH